MLNDAVDGGRGRHAVLEDLIPLREHQIRRDQNALSVLPLGEQREEHLHFGAVLLHVADIVEGEAFKAIEALQPAGFSSRPRRSFRLAASSFSTRAATVA